MNVHEIPTPAILVDDAVVNRNIRNLTEYAKQHRIDLRPHTKTHKSLEMARRQIEAGAVGLTVAKAGEADVMVAETDDLMVAYPALDAPRCQKLAHLAAGKTVRVAVDSIMAIDALASAAAAAEVTLGILVEIDAGFHRTGVQSASEALALAEQIDRARGVRLDGLMFFPGQINDPPEQQLDALGIISEQLNEIIGLWSSHGLEAAIVSGGSTPTAYQSHRIPALTEMRPGTYLYNDMDTVHSQACSLDDCAARLVCTVVSTAVPGQAVIDAGSKALTSDQANWDPQGGGYGYVVEHPEAKITRLSEEHGVIDVSTCENPPKLGDRVHVIPNHICPCINLQDFFWLHTEDGSVHKLPVDTRGRLS